MAREDYTMERGTRTFRINRPGHDKLGNHIRQSLAAAYKNTMEVLIKKGMPRIVVDHGKINTKLSFYLAKAEEETKPKLPFWSGTKTMLPRITVKPLNVRAPEVLGLKASVAGEIEVTFKTISE